MDSVKYNFEDHVRISGSKYIFQSCTKQKLSNIYHSHNFYELYILFRGTVSHTVNSTEHLMSEGDCVLLTPQDAHCFHMQSENLELVALSVQCEEFTAIANIYDSQLAASHKAAFFSCLERLQDLKNQTGRCHLGLKDNENKLLLSILLSIYCDWQKNKQPEIPATLSSAFAKMGTDEHIKEGLPAFLRLTNYSYPHLYRLVRQYYGTTPHQLILQLRLDAAYSQLIRSDCSVEQIAENVGFHSASHFIKVFKAHFGTSPAKLRMQKQSFCF